MKIVGGDLRQLHRVGGDTLQFRILGPFIWDRSGWFDHFVVFRTCLTSLHFFFEKFGTTVVINFLFYFI